MTNYEDSIFKFGETEPEAKIVLRGFIENDCIRDETGAMSNVKAVISKFIKSCGIGDQIEWKQSTDGLTGEIINFNKEQHGTMFNLFNYLKCVNMTPSNIKFIWESELGESFLSQQDSFGYILKNTGICSIKEWNNRTFSAHVKYFNEYNLEFVKNLWWFLYPSIYFSYS